MGTTTTGSVVNMLGGLAIESHAIDDFAFISHISYIIFDWFWRPKYIKVIDFTFFFTVDSTRVFRRLKQRNVAWMLLYLYFLSLQCCFSYDCKRNEKRKLIVESVRVVERWCSLQVHLTRTQPCNTYRCRHSKLTQSIEIFQTVYSPKTLFSYYIELLGNTGNIH